VTRNSVGQLTSLNTWLYKPPSTLEIPHRFNVRLYPLQSQISAWKDEERRRAAESGGVTRAAGVLERVAQAHPSNRLRKGWLRVDALDQVIDPYGVQSSKTTGEPPLVLANAVYFAIRQAARAALGQTMYEPGVQQPVAAAPDVFLACPATTFNIRQSILSVGQPVRHVHAETVKAVVSAIGPPIGSRGKLASAAPSTAAAAGAASPLLPKSQSAARRSGQVAPLLPTGSAALSAKLK
jgi:hypothetical protein